MVEHAWRRILFILILIGLGITFLLSNGIRLGLDLQGGSRLVYRVDLDKLSAQTASEGTKKELSEADRTRIMDETLLIISQRIDPRGTTDANITVAGSERLLIELPGMEEHELDQVVRRIKTLGKLDMRMVVERDYLGGFFEMDQERERLEKWLKKPEVKDEIARDPLYIQRFNEMAGTDEGPKNKYLKWFPMKRRENPNWDKKTPETRWLWERSSIPDETQHYLPINYHEKVHFTGEDIDSKTIRPGINQRDNTPALNYEIVPGRKGEYADWSDVYTKKHSAIILNDYVEIAPVFNERIPGNVQVSGNFKKEEVDELVIVLKTGSLKIVPELESRSSIGATLGQLAIDKGKFSIMLGGLLIVFFMMVYYRWAAGSIACLSLLVNLFLVFGGIALIKATLTLPGLAGIVLTIGMAVDANILIFERIREEKDRGKDLKRSVEAGFERAMSTILDANITTFLTGLILYNVGIGPIRGFAVTLMFGIVTSVFSALYVSKTIFHLLIAGERIKQLSMSRLFATPDLNLLRFRSLTTLLSIVAVALGLFWFFQTPPAGKYGIDFTGGAVVRARMREPMAQQEIYALLSKNEAFSAEFPEPQVTSLGGGSGGKYHEFSIKLKLNPEKRRELEKRKAEARKNNQDYTAPYLTLIKGALEQQLTYDPYEDPKAYTVTISGVPRGGGECRIHFTSAVRAEDLRQQLEKRNAGVKVFVLDASGERVDEQEGTDFLVALDLPAGTESGQLPPKLSQDLAGLTDMKGQEVALSSPFPEESLIDPRAVGHLTQAALASIILSLFLIVMYIRVRFHEFKYGIAACIALIHDVSIVLGITVLLNRYEIIHAEIDLSMIAAFLTIIGYSLNDTIVMFDRIRENLNLKKKFGETKLDFRRLVDQSVDQNLSRTVLTSVTTFLVVSAQFVFNHGAGSVLEGFSFAMMAGIIVGTYSSIWVANPIVLWLHEREAALARSAASPGPATLGTTP